MTYSHIDRQREGLAVNHSETGQLGDLIWRAQLAAGLSQEQLAERSGLSARTISDLERGQRKTPHLESLRMLAAGLDLSSEDRKALLQAARPNLQQPLRTSAPALVPDPGLPVADSPLIGREREVDDIVSQVRGDERRLTTLTGPGGVGKTRLALEVANVAEPFFPDGAVFVDLAPITDPQLVASAIAQALGVQETETRPLWETLGITVRHRGILLLLDNFEQVIEAAPEIATLLSNAPELRILATSREHLRVRGEHEVIIQPLELPDRAEVEPERLKDNPAAALFVQAARTVAPEFGLTPGNALAVAEICRRLDGLPLAIELAASRVKYYPTDTLLEHLDRRLSVLTGGPRDLPTRQQTLRDTIAWSYDLLSPGERALFRRLGIFPAGSTIPAIDTVAMESGVHEIDLLSGLASLVDKSLIRRAIGSDGRPRFTMLETLREFAIDALLQAGEADGARRALAQWILRFVSENFGQSFVSHSMSTVDLLVLDEEFENVRLAFAQFSECGDAASCATLFTSLHYYLYLRGRFREGLEFGKRSLELAEQQLIPDHLLGITLSFLGNLETMAGHIQDGETSAREGLSLLARSPEHRRLIPSALLCLAINLREHGRYAEARVYAEEALAVVESSDDPRLSSFALYQIGRLAFLQNDLDRAAACFRESLRQATASIQNGTIWSSLISSAAVQLRRGDLAAAAESLREADRIWQEIGGEIVSLALNVVGAFVARVQPVDAVRIYGAVRAHSDAIGVLVEDEPWIAEVKSYLCTVLGEAMFEEAYYAGQSLSIEDAMELMRDALDQFERTATH